MQARDAAFHGFGRAAEMLLECAGAKLVGHAEGFCGTGQVQQDDAPRQHEVHGDHGAFLVRVRPPARRQRA
ncbi:hypothetical protein G6F46_015798 [Rhizopus delemar]|nr:hypothetical protein G6F22_014912 [Rhizopus arrhizus]KAG1578265.1 hypothetical protein G6F46_015798 [Rhizopus delemar]